MTRLPAFPSCIVVVVSTVLLCVFDVGSALEKMRAMGLSLAKAKEKHYDCTALVKKLRAMVHATEDQNLVLRRQGLFLSQVAARTVPKGLFCLHMRLTIDYWAMTPQQQELPGKEKLEDRSLYHYALFSDNVLACSVVVNSTIANCKVLLLRYLNVSH